MTSKKSVYKEQLKKECVLRQRKLSTTIYGLIYINCDNEERYIVACSSDGTICVWDTFLNDQKISNDDMNVGYPPNFNFKVSDGTLYDVQFVDKSPQKSLLITCGDAGVFLYQWNDILKAMANTLPKKTSSQVEIKHVAIMNPYPTSSLTPTEVNRISYDANNGYLYGACGDLFGGYIWDVNTNKVIGTLGQRNQNQRHKNYLHTIKAVCPANSNDNKNRFIITGDESGEVGIWDGKDQRLIEMINMKSSLIECHDGSSSQDDIDTGNFTSSDNNSTFQQLKNGNKNISLWVSSIDVDESCQWGVIGGGFEHYSDSLGGLSKQLDNGFLALVNLETRKVHSCSTTRENVNEVAFCHDTSMKIVSVGNNNTISFWNSNDLSKGRVGRSLVSSPSSYAIAVPKAKGGLVAVAGVGSLIDCYSEHGTKFCTLKFQSI
jgi:hypothetical protein